MIDPQTGTVSIRAAFDNASRLLTSGGSGNVVLQKTIEGALCIPRTATFEIQDKVFVYRLADGNTAARCQGVEAAGAGLRAGVPLRTYRRRSERLLHAAHARCAVGGSGADGGDVAADGGHDPPHEDGGHVRRGGNDYE
ncbi:MAG: hypothetical protein ACI30A_01385 [Paludibacteraceae bacterium]